MTFWAVTISPNKSTCDKSDPKKKGILLRYDDNNKQKIKRQKKMP